MTSVQREWQGEGDAPTFARVASAIADATAAAFALQARPATGELVI
jgi:hypothetical protein